MRKVQVLFGLAIVAMLATQATAALPIGSGGNAQEVGLLYDPASGNLSTVHTGDVSISTFELLSAGGNFTGTKPPQIDGTGLFDVFNASKFFLLRPAGFGEQDFGPMVASGLSVADVAADMTLNGSTVNPAGPLPYTYVVPEPSSIALICCGLLGLLRIRRK